MQDSKINKEVSKIFFKYKNASIKDAKDIALAAVEKIALWKDDSKKQAFMDWTKSKFFYKQSVIDKYIKELLNANIDIDTIHNTSIPYLQNYRHNTFVKHLLVIKDYLDKLLSLINNRSEFEKTINEVKNRIQSC